MNPRIMPLVWRSTMASMRAFWRVTRQVFHEAMGAFFAVFAVYGLMAAWRQWRVRPVAWVIAFAIAYTITMSAFSVASFRRARKIGLEGGDEVS